MIRTTKKSGFTLVELMIVIIVIAILAAIITVAYNGIRRQAATSVLKADLSSAARQIENYKTTNGTSMYPPDVSGVTKNDTTTLFYELIDQGYCLAATSSYPGVPIFYVSNSVLTPTEGTCPGQPVGGGSAVVFSTIEANNDSSCALLQNQVYCWGTNTYGQIGNGTTTIAGLPVAVTTSGVLSGKTVTRLAASAGIGTHRCVIADAKPYCWGSNLYGELGNNSTTASSVPVAVDTSGVLNGKAVTQIAVGGHTCAIADGAAYCWGRNFSGSLGNNSTTDSYIPVAVNTAGVLSGKTVTQIAAGDEYFSCAVADGRAYCWGINTTGRLGNNTTASSSVPVAVDTSGVLAGKTVTKIALGRHHACAIADGAAYCWGGGTSPYGSLGHGQSTWSQTPVAVDTSGVLAGKTITDIAAGYRFTCVIADGLPYCWGWNSEGRLGNGTTTNSYVPVAVNTATGLAGKTATSIDAGGAHACVIASGQAYCWGDGSTRALGQNSGTDYLSPNAISPLP